ncbi:hypothetical protein EYZ11_001835 [Aspergillus tanneri]|uniref:Serine-threonine protein kinase 19 n=1 Tax=Aspergillus tanneri TaxID=1220188 RepID=A0A4S3JU92_9EURO|nr:hypothetical protein EYZ11_001835 [Aspergillus tanneri]
MPLRITSAPISGVKKRKSPASSRLRASPFSSHARRKATTLGSQSTTASGDACPEDHDHGPLPDLGLSRYIPETALVENVVQALCYVRDHMFENLPARAGMSSTRSAEVLNFRRSLPPLVSVAHVHTLLDAPTKVEKEIMELVNSGRIRRLVVPGRGNDAAGSTVPGAAFTASEYMALVRAGFLVSSSFPAQGSLSIASLPSLPSPSVAENPASRSDSAAQPTQMEAINRSQLHSATLFLSLPNTGPYLRLLAAGRAHLLSLLKKSPEIPLDLLRDRWDGAVESEKSFSVAKRARGEFAGVLPGRTKKWKELYGMNFRWVLEEAIGAGLVEIFDTGSVGPGIRCL